MRTILVALLLLSRPVFAEEVVSTIDKLSWLKGCWGLNKDGREITEHWLGPSGKTMLGVSRTVADGKTVEFEFMQIRQLDNGEIVFIAKPSGQSEARFTLIKAGTAEMIFENPSHDFPQRVIYRLGENGLLLGRIEGVSNGKEKAADFPLQRISCDR